MLNLVSGRESEISSEMLRSVSTKGGLDCAPARIIVACLAGLLIR